MKTVKLFFFLVILSASCSKNNGNEGDRNKITIIGENSATIQALMELEEAYEEKMPNIDLDFKPNTFEDAFNKVNQDFANSTGIYDVVMQYNFSLSSFVRNNYVFPLDELLSEIPDSLKNFENEIFQNAWKEVGYFSDGADGMIKVGYPWASNTMLLMYNKKMFESENQKIQYKEKYDKDLTPPKEWEEFHQIADFFTQSEQDFKGVCMEGASGGWLYFEFMNFLYGLGGKVMDKRFGWEGDGNTKVMLNSPEVLSALKFYKSLKPYNSGNFTNIEQYEQMRIMKQRRTAMAIVWSDVIFPSLKEDSSFLDDFGFVPIPGEISILAGGAFFINKKSKNPKVVMDYIIDLMQPESQIQLARRGVSSSLKSAYQDSIVMKLPYTSALVKSLERGVYTLEAGPDADMISEKITTYVQKYWNDEISAETAVNKMQEEIESERKIIFDALRN